MEWWGVSQESNPVLPTDKRVAEWLGALDGVMDQLGLKPASHRAYLPLLSVSIIATGASVREIKPIIIII